jgi:hypothetical protein
MSPVTEIQSLCMGYLNFWHALTYRNARVKKTAVNSIITTSCIQGLPVFIRISTGGTSLGNRTLFEGRLFPWASRLSVAIPHRARPIGLTEFDSVVCLL